MDGKILPIDTGSCETSVTLEQLIENLNNIPSETLEAYVAITKEHVTETCILLNIFSNIDNKILLRFLIGDLDQNKIDKFNRIALHISTDNPTEKIGELVYLTFDSKEIDPHKLDRINIFIDKVKSLDIDLMQKAIDFMQQANVLLKASKSYELASKITEILSTEVPRLQSEIFKKLVDLPEDNINILFELLTNKENI